MYYANSQIIYIKKVFLNEETFFYDEHDFTKNMEANI